MKFIVIFNLRKGKRKDDNFMLFFITNNLRLDTFF